MSRTQKHMAGGILGACLLAVVMIFTAPRFVAVVNAADCHPQTCHHWDPPEGMDEIFLYWWFECDLPHCPECMIVG